MEERTERAAMPPEERELMKRWVQQWRITEPLLQAQKMRELQTMTDEQALDWIDTALALAEGQPIEPERWNYSGFVDQQRYFRKLRHVEPHL